MNCTMQGSLHTVILETAFMRKNVLKNACSMQAVQNWNVIWRPGTRWWSGLWTGLTVRKRWISHRTMSYTRRNFWASGNWSIRIRRLPSTMASPWASWGRYRRRFIRGRQRNLFFRRWNRSGIRVLMTTAGLFPICCITIWRWERRRHTNAGRPNISEVSRSRERSLLICFGRACRSWGLSAWSSPCMCM